LFGELLHGGRDIRKGIGFVRKCPGYNPHCPAPCLKGELAQLYTALKKHAGVAEKDLEGLHIHNIRSMPCKS
jgi:hypothetical protein